MKKTILSLAFLSTMAMLQLNAGDQFAMSDADRAMYKEMLENNPADIFVEEGGELLEESLGGEEALAKFLGISEKELPKYIVGIDQVLQAMEVSQGKKKTKLKSSKMFSMLAYVKSLANDEIPNIDLSEANEKEAYLRTQPLPDLGEVASGATWPAYRMTKSSLRTPQRRFQGCMKNALLKVIPIGSKEMIALEVYVTKLAQEKNKKISIPGLKR